MKASEDAFVALMLLVAVLFIAGVLWMASAPYGRKGGNPVEPAPLSDSAFRLGR